MDGKTRNLDAAVDTLDGCGDRTTPGQCCCGIERIYVAEPLFQAFVREGGGVVEGLPARATPSTPRRPLGADGAARFRPTTVRSRRSPRRVALWGRRPHIRETFARTTRAPI